MEPVFFNFGDLGQPGWTPVTKFEMRLILAGAETLIQGHTREEVEHLIMSTHERLLKRACCDQVDEDWVSQALLITAMRGLLGYPVPEVLHWDDE